MTGLPIKKLDASLELLATIVPFQSVAGNLPAQRALASWLERWLTEETEARVILPVAAQPNENGPPLVHVRIDTGASTTVVLYNMYDVMPASSEGWEVDPFTGGVRRWADKGDVFIARGAENNKGPLAGMLTTVRDLWHSGRLHINLEILLEGEEEIGSGNLRRYLAQHPCPVAPAEAVLFPSLCEYGNGAPRIYLGFTGMTTGRLTVQGGDWGGPETAIHASNAAWIANPAWRLVEALNCIAPAHNNGVLQTRPIAGEDAELLDELASHFSIHDELLMRRSKRLTIDAAPWDALAHLLGSAVLNINEISTIPQGGRGIIPPQATAELALRTPPDIDHTQLLARMQRTLACGPLAGARLIVDDSYPGYRFSLDDIGVLELINSYHQQRARPQIWPWAPGCAPAYAFAPIAPAFLIGGLGYGGNAHGVNEFVTLQGMQRFQQSLSDWLLAF